MTLKDRFKKTYDFIMIFIDQIGKKDILTQSAALSYYCALSLAPLLVLLVTFSGFLGPDSKEGLVTQVNQTLGSQASTAVTAILKSTDTNKSQQSTSGVLGFIFLLVSASSVFSQLKSSITFIFSDDDACKPDTEVNEEPGWLAYLQKKIFSIGMMISFILLSVFSLIFSVVLSFILPEGEGFMIQGLNQIINFFIYAFVFFLVFHFVPSKPVDKKYSWIGGLLTSFLFILGRGLISVYLSGASVSSAYGAAGSLIVLLIWVYYSSFILFASALATSLLPKIKTNFKGTSDGTAPDQKTK